MIRRRRRVREIPFSFDSFLDVVANVVGIIIRLILVVWVGARSYSSLHLNAVKSASPRTASAEETSELEDPLRNELSARHSELEQLRASLLKQLGELDQFRSKNRAAERELVVLAEQQGIVREEHKAADQAAVDQEGAARSMALSAAELRDRQHKLAREIHDLSGSPPPSRVLRYRTPVSRPVRSDEFFFECRRGRVAFIDVPALLAEARQDLESKGELLRTRWSVSEVTGPIGGYRLRYTVARERGLSDSLTSVGEPEPSANFRYSLSEWVVEPVAADHGETLAAALTERSEFRQVTDRLDPQLAVVTFWVYPDSFAVFRSLRDYLYERDLVVAGRPLPEGVPITCSRNGTLSQGQ
jgi:hypothetical protein